MKRQDLFSLGKRHGQLVGVELNTASIRLYKVLEVPLNVVVRALESERISVTTNGASYSLVSVLLGVAAFSK